MYCYRHPDRETGVSCSECGRGICPDCMVFAPVGIRCPDHAGVPGHAKVTTGVRRAAYEGTGALVTKTLIAINVLVFFMNLAQGSTLSRVSGSLFENGALYIGSPFTSGLADGEWWRLITLGVPARQPGHLGMNMLVLWIVGAPVEQAIGRERFLALYIVSGLAGSAGALLFSQRHHGRRVGRHLRDPRRCARARGAREPWSRGQAFGLIAFNLVLTFAIPNISIGGHLGGLAGGGSGMLALSRFGRTHAIYGRPGLVGVVGLIAVGLASVLVAYARQGVT